VAPEYAAGHGGWVFPTSSRDGRSVVATSNWTEPTLGANECGHALRHTYRTVGAAGAGVPYDVAELLVAHVLPGVGSRYVHPGELDARLRAAQCSVTEHLLRVAGAAGGGVLYGLDVARG
jgi:integrase